MLFDASAVIVALLTPFDPDGRLDEGALREHVEVLLEAGVDGLMPCGTTGEGAVLSEDEVAGVVRATVAAAGGRAPVLAHVGRPGTSPTLELARRALADGAAAVSAVVPYFYPLGADQVRAHYAALADGLAGAELYAYTIPGNTHNELDAELLPRLAGDGVAGMKDSTKSLERHREYAAVARELDGFSLFDGSASLVLESLREGSAGAVLAIANLRPDLCVALLRAHREGQDEEAERLQEELTAAEKELGAENPMAALKRALSAQLRERGVAYGPELRAPAGAAGIPAQGARA